MRPFFRVCGSSGAHPPPKETRLRVIQVPLSYHQKLSPSLCSATKWPSQLFRTISVRLPCLPEFVLPTRSMGFLCRSVVRKYLRPVNSELRAVYFRLVGFRLLHTSIHMPMGNVISTITITNSGTFNVTPLISDGQVHWLHAYMISAETPATKVDPTPYFTTGYFTIRFRKS